MATRTAELRSALEAKTAELRQAVDAVDVQVDGENTYVSPSAARQVKALRDDVESIRSLLEAETMATDVKAWLDSPTGESVTLSGAERRMLEGKSLGELFTASMAFKSFQKSGRLTMAEPFEVNVTDLPGRAGAEFKNVYAGMAGNAVTRGLGPIQFDPMVPRGQRPTRIRNLFPAATTQSNLIDYFRVMGFAENSGRGNAGTVPDWDTAQTPDNFGLKPQSNLTFQNAQAPVRTVAHWEAAHRNVISDVPQLQATINNELLYGLALQEDLQLLSGDGTGDNLLGVLNTPGIQSYTAPATAELGSDSLRRAITKAVIANYPPTGIVIHPNDWEKIELQKAASGAQQYALFTNVAIGMQAQIWRLPVVETVAINELTFLVGAFGTGAQLYDRQAASIRIAEQHADFFIRNAVVILAEERLALAVKRPESFVKGTFDYTP